jgi:hypothetical protein
LKAPGTKRLELLYDGPLSNIAFNSNLRRYIPFRYLHMLQLILFFFVFSAPLVFTTTFHWIAFIPSVIVAVGFYGINEMGKSIQDPFNWQQPCHDLSGLGGALQVDPIKPALKAPGTKRLNLQYDEPLSNFAFKFYMRRYTWACACTARTWCCTRTPPNTTRHPPAAAGGTAAAAARPASTAPTASTAAARS